MMSKIYEKLDTLILKAVADGNMFPDTDYAVDFEAQRIACTRNWYKRPMIKRRLRALRDEGKIRYLFWSEAPSGLSGWYPAENKDA